MEEQDILTGYEAFESGDKRFCDLETKAVYESTIYLHNPATQEQLNWLNEFMDDSDIDQDETMAFGFMATVIFHNSDTPYGRTIGVLSHNFITNNPMNVEDCRAIVQIIDYSNGQMKNISASIIVDTDLMSGDAIDLNNDMLAGLNPSEQLAQ